MRAKAAHGPGQWRPCPTVAGIVGVQGHQHVRHRLAHVVQQGRKHERFLLLRREAAAQGCSYVGRLLGVFPHDAPDAIATNMDQAFIWTNVVASGPLRLGQVIEVQWHLQKEQTN